MLHLNVSQYCSVSSSLYLLFDEISNHFHSVICMQFLPSVDVSFPVMPNLQVPQRLQTRPETSLSNFLMSV